MLIYCLVIGLALILTCLDIAILRNNLKVLEKEYNDLLSQYDYVSGVLNSRTCKYCGHIHLYDFDICETCGSIKSE